MSGGTSVYACLGVAWVGRQVLGAIENSPSGSRGLILGEIRGCSAGLALIEPRFECPFGSFRALRLPDGGRLSDPVGFGSIIGDELGVAFADDLWIADNRGVICSSKGVVVPEEDDLFSGILVMRVAGNVKNMQSSKKTRYYTQAFSRSCQKENQIHFRSNNSTKTI